MMGVQFLLPRYNGELIDLDKDTLERPENFAFAAIYLGQISFWVALGIELRLPYDLKGLTSGSPPDVVIITN